VWPVPRAHCPLPGNNMTDCIFCKIIEKKIPAKVVYEDDIAFAFEDINPKAPVHLLVIPKKHIPTVLELKEGDDDHLIGHLFKIANKIAKDKGIADKGFRLVTNCNPDSGQTVYHIHLHLLGGRIMHWPPG
jgi:histidine triad (HIT) family protein